MIALFIPVVKESYHLILGNAFQKATHLRITVDTHTFRKQWMVECKIRIILAGIFFINWNTVTGTIKFIRVSLKTWT